MLLAGLRLLDLLLLAGLLARLRLLDRLRVLRRGRRLDDVDGRLRVFLRPLLLRLLRDFLLLRLRLLRLRLLLETTGRFGDAFCGVLPFEAGVVVLVLGVS